jgi:adenylate cyclase
VANQLTKRLKRWLVNFVVAVLFATVATLLATVSGLFSGLDGVLADAMYQRESAEDNRVIVIGYDDYALEELGRFQDWDRGLWAEALRILNGDPEHLPAAIGIDTLFDTAGSGYDAELADAAALADNVVLASFAEFGEEIIEHSDGNFSLDSGAVLWYSEAYTELREVTRAGHVNVTFDSDGVLRRVMGAITIPGGEKAPPFSYELYRLYSGGEPQVRDTDGRWYMCFTGKPGMFYYYSFADLLYGYIEPEELEDRVVLLGPYASGLADDYITSIDRSEKMYGVEFQANAVNALINGDFAYEADERIQFAIVFVVTLALTLFLIARSAWLSTLTAAAVIGTWLGMSMALRWNAGTLLHPMWLTVSAVISYVATLAYNYFKSARAHKLVIDTFKKYVAPEIVQEILKTGADLTVSHTVDIAVLFVDIRGFTAMSEALQNEWGDAGPSKVVELLNKYLTLTSSCVMNNGGTLDKFVGDATMAFWGAPLPCDDYVYKAVHAAMDMIAGAEAVGEELYEQFGKKVGFGIGVHCGKAVVGNVGALKRMDYTAIGDTVNTAARLEANAPAGELWISQATLDMLGDRVTVSSLGKKEFKNKTEFEVFRVEMLNA